MPENNNTTAFNDEQFGNAYADGMQYTYWHIARKKLILKYIRRFKLDNILDIGCGRGFVTSYLFDSGINITGVELGSNSKIESAVPIYYNTDAIKLPEAIRAAIKTITLFDVIEHIEDPVSFLKTIKGNFPALENILITVPARKELWTNFDDYYGHFRRYDISMMKKEAEDSGYELVFCRYFFHSLYPVIRINNVVQKKREVNFNPPKGKLSILINRVIAGLFYLEDKLYPGSFRGSSLMGIYRSKNPK